jgi:hypothetical protein
MSILASFLLRNRHYLLRVIGAVLALRFEAGTSWAAILAGLAGGGYPALRTIQHWCSSYGEQARRWLKAVLVYGGIARRFHHQSEIAPAYESGAHERLKEKDRENTIGIG